SRTVARRPPTWPTRPCATCARRWGSTMRNAMGLRLGIALLLASAGTAWAAHPIPVGESSFQFVDARGQADRPITLHSYRPADCDAKSPLVIVMAGVQRNAADYRGYWER